MTVRVRVLNRVLQDGGILEFDFVALNVLTQETESPDDECLTPVLEQQEASASVLASARQACELDHAGIHLRQWLHWQDKHSLSEDLVYSIVSALPDDSRVECVVALWSLVQSNRLAYSLFKLCPSMGQRVLCHRLGPLLCIDPSDPAGSFSLDLQYKDARQAVEVLFKAMTELPKYQFDRFEIDQESYDEVDVEHSKPRQEWQQFRQQFIAELPTQGMCEVVITNGQCMFPEDQV